MLGGRFGEPYLVMANSLLIKAISSCVVQFLSHSYFNVWCFLTYVVRCLSMFVVAMCIWIGLCNFSNYAIRLEPFLSIACDSYLNWLVKIEFYISVNVVYRLASHLTKRKVVHYLSPIFVFPDVQERSENIFSSSNLVWHELLPVQYSEEGCLPAED